MSKSKQVEVLDVLENQFYVMNRNYQVLKEQLAVVNDREKMMALWNDRPSLHLMMREVSRQFQNFVASVRAFIDCTKKAIDRLHKGTKFYSEYDQEYKNRTDSPFAHFMRELRNYAAHYQLPLSDSQLRGSATGVSLGFVLNKTRLLQYTGWSKASNFIASLPEQIDVEQLADQCHQEMSEFYVWIRYQIRHELAVKLGMIRAEDPLPDELSRQ